MSEVLTLLPLLVQSTNTDAAHPHVALDLVRLRRKQLAWDTLKKRIATAVRYSRLYRYSVYLLYLLY